MADRPPGRRVVLLGGSRSACTALVRFASRRRDLRSAAAEIDEAITRYDSPPVSFALKSGRRSLRKGPLIMAVLTVTPDSFSDGGRFLDPPAALDRALQMAEEGANLIDVGAESTRPGAMPVTLDEELRRVIPVLEMLVPALERKGKARPLVSIDTTKAEVVRCAAEVGVDMVNDISGMTFDPEMPAAVAASRLPVVLQHIQGDPRTMQRSPRYAHLVPEIASFLRSRIEHAVAEGVRLDRILIDPGIGFGKRREDNLAILKHLAAFRSLGRPILIGASRKSFVGDGREAPADRRLEGSLAAEALAIAGGADIIRVHDTRQAVLVARLCHAVLHCRTP